MKALARIYMLLVDWGGPIVLSLFLLFMRVVFGWGFFVAGKGKLSDIPANVSRFREWGIPKPEWNVPFVIGVEIVGGLLLLAGLGSRFVGAVLAINMMVALSGPPGDREAVRQLFAEAEFLPFMRTTPFWFLVTSLLVLACGPGWFSVDALLKRFVFRGIGVRRGESV